jgi:hypothetical protein
MQKTSKKDGLLRLPDPSVLLAIEKAAGNDHSGITELEHEQDI